MVAKLVLIIIVVFFSYLEIATAFRLKRHLDALRRLAQLEKEYPGYGKDFVYAVDQHGIVRCLYLKVDQGDKRAYDQFLETEENSQNKNTGLHPLGSFAAVGSGSTHIPKKFNFNSEDITLTWYNRKYKSGINLTNSFDFSKYNDNILTKVVTHGFQSSGTSDTCITIKNNYLKVEDVNVIVLDWGQIAANVIYPITAASTSKVADYASKFLAYLIRHVGVRDEDVHLIGHSLGAHTMGFIGKRLILNYDIKIGRITGLDPAGPLFGKVHLNKRDAYFVDIIHTNGGVFGLNNSIGHVDFYPNSGDSPQPGCERKSLLVVDACSHGMSWEYFADSIINTQKYIGKCTNGKKLPMGAETPQSARGICSLDTDDDNGTTDDEDKPKSGIYYLVDLVDRGVKKITKKVYTYFRNIIG